MSKTEHIRHELSGGCYMMEYKGYGGLRVNEEYFDDQDRLHRLGGPARVWNSLDYEEYYYEGICVNKVWLLEKTRQRIIDKL